MSKERELLAVALEFLDPRSWVDPEDIYALTIISSEIQELLAQPEQEPIAYVAAPSIGFDVSRSPQGMPLVWLGKLEYGDKLYRVGKDDE